MLSRKWFSPSHVVLVWLEKTICCQRFTLVFVVNCRQFWWGSCIFRKLLLRWIRLWKSGKAHEMRNDQDIPVDIKFHRIILSSAFFSNLYVPDIVILDILFVAFATDGQGCITRQVLGGDQVTSVMWVLYLVLDFFNLKWFPCMDFCDAL